MKLIVKLGTTLVIVALTNHRKEPACDGGTSDEEENDHSQQGASALSLSAAGEKIKRFGRHGGPQESVVCKSGWEGSPSLHLSESCLLFLNWGRGQLGTFRVSFALACTDPTQAQAGLVGPISANGLQTTGESATSAPPYFHVHSSPH